MKILSVVGSPRKNANTHFMSQHFCQVLEEMGAQCQEVFLNELQVAPCQHCGGCRKDAVCKVEDDFWPIIESLRQCDGLVLSTPVYCCNVTAQMKAFMDRCHCLCYPDWETGLEGISGKPVALLVGAGFPPLPDESFVVHHKARFNTFVKMVKALKLSQGLSLRENLDPFAPFDPTVDCLRTLFQFCAFVDLEVVASLEVVGLGHARQAIRSRPRELEKIADKARMFGGMVRMIKERAFF